jgi:DNA repair exonuclease SbcCD nuclease subunit
MGKFILFSDIHIHPHKKSAQRLQDCLKALEWVFETAKARNVDAIMFGGDLMHDRQKIDTFTYYSTYKVLEKYAKEKFKVYLVVGNHDMWFSNSREVSSVMPFDAIENIEVISKTCSKVIAGMNWHFLPYCHDPIKELKTVAYGCEEAYLLGHISVDGAKLNTAGSLAEVVIEHDNDMVKVKSDIFGCYKRAFFGHYHCQQRLDEKKKIEYIGSPLQLTFGEAGDQKHIIFVDSNSDTIEYIVNDFSPVHLKLSPSECAKLSPEEISKNFICLVTDETCDTNEAKKELQKLVDSGAASVQIKKEHQKMDEHSIKDAKALFEDESKILERYVQQVESSSLDKNKLIEIGHRIMRYEGDNA